MSDQCYFDDTTMGYQRTQDFAMILGVTERSVRGWRKEKKSPVIDQAKIRQANDLHWFPLDSFPEEIIGEIACQIITFLRAGKPREALQLALCPISWTSGQLVNSTPVQKLFIDFLKIVAWLRHPDRVIRDNNGFLEAKRMKESFETNETDELRRYLSGMLTIYSLVYDMYFCRQEHISHTDKEILDTTKTCRILIHEMGEIKKECGQALVAWNTLQFAALFEDDALFIDGIPPLRKFYREKRLINLLKQDPDTERMLRKKRVRDFLEWPT